MHGIYIYIFISCAHQITTILSHGSRHSVAHNMPRAYNHPNHHQHQHHQHLVTRTSTTSTLGGSGRVCVVCGMRERTVTV